eukprot:CAMPEP_0115363976 /NCGR_PEP_ID=MMETSP0270-20121206/103517_1 /TAXON_ID=71861 /ORGANISM="Scrippsiella trochoidea, Strain CCMP3099" /LENGTH=299 /DNA_ID=CAMNT_0002786633 /DNA_START=70 /DNA_END=970 /DNA_ORIENTATION=-
MDALPSDYRLFAASTARYTDDDTTDSHGDAHGAMDAHHRRLGKANLSQESAAFEELLKLVPALGELADKIQAGEAYRAGGDSLSQAISASPALPPPQAASVAEHELSAEPFALEGLGEWGPLAGATLAAPDDDGKLLHCPGHEVPASGAWPCQESQHPPLPMPTGSELVSAAFAEDASAASTNLLVALVFKNMPEIAALYRAVAGSWHPAGEVHVPPGSGPQPSLGFDGVENLLVTGAAGEVHRRHLAGGTHALHPAPAGASAREFRSACVLPEGQIIRLALRQMDTSAPSRPELILSA